MPERASTRSEPRLRDEFRIRLIELADEFDSLDHREHDGRIIDGKVNLGGTEIQDDCQFIRDWARRVERDHDERADAKPLSEQWADAVAAVVDQAHEENWGGKHRSGFCEACADAYLVAQHAISDPPAVPVRAVVEALREEAKREPRGWREWLPGRGLDRWRWLTYAASFVAERFNLTEER